MKRLRAAKLGLCAANGRFHAPHNGLRAAFILAAALLGVLPAAPNPESNGAQPAPCGLAWVNRFRAARGVSALAPEPALERAAAAYARVLAGSGRLAHRDAAGRRALERYRAAGGSAVRVGEILGAGPDLPAVTKAWEGSPAHAAVAADPGWTRAGAGCAPLPAGPAGADRGEVWVVLFAEQEVEGFAVVRGPEPVGGYLVSGRFPDRAAASPVLLSGLEAIAPLSWEPDRREFLFRVPAGSGALYHRLGFRSAGGEFRLTSAFYPRLAASAGGREGE